MDRQITSGLLQLLVIFPRRFGTTEGDSQNVVCRLRKNELTRLANVLRHILERTLVAPRQQSRNVTFAPYRGRLE